MSFPQKVEGKESDGRDALSEQSFVSFDLLYLLSLLKGMPFLEIQ
jgi:hypothetical protein